MISIEISSGWTTYLSDFGSLAAFVAAVVLVITLIKDIKNNNKLKKERISSEILKWVNKISEYMLSRNLPPFEETIIRATRERYFGEYLEESTKDIVIAEYTKFRRRSVYITGIAKAFPEIQEYVDIAIKHLRSKIRLLNVYTNRSGDIYEKEDGIKKAALNIARNEDRLYSSLVRIIRETGGNINLLI